MIELSPHGRQHVSRPIIVALAVALMAGSTFGLMVVQPLMHFAKYRNQLGRFVPVAAVVISSSPVPKRVHDHWEPDLEYQYTHASITYRSSRVRLWGNASPKSSDWFASQFPPGAEFQAYVDPDDPANAVMFNDIPPRFQMLPGTLIPIWSLLFPLMSPARLWGRKWRHPELPNATQSALVGLDTQPYSVVWLLFSWIVLAYGLFTVLDYALEVGSRPVISIVILCAVLVPATTGSITITSRLNRAKARSYAIFITRRGSDTSEEPISLRLAQHEASSAQILRYELTVELEAIKGSDDPAFADLSNEWVRLKRASAEVTDPAWRPLPDPAYGAWSESTRELLLDTSAALAPEDGSPTTPRRRLLSCRCKATLTRSSYPRSMRLECLLPIEDLLTSEKQRLGQGSSQTLGQPCRWDKPQP